MRSAQGQRVCGISILGAFLLPIFTSCLSDAPGSEPADQIGAQKSGYEVSVLDQHRNRVVHDTVVGFRVESLDSLNDGVYHVVTKRLSDSNLEFQTVTIGKDSWMENGVGTLRGVEIQDFFCALTTTEMPISGYCEQVTAVLRFEPDVQGTMGGAVWTRCGFEVGAADSLNWAKWDRGCVSSLKSAFLGVNHFEKLFGEASALRVATDSNGIIFLNDSMSIQWRRN